ncbi:DNA primase [Lacticaseibacillus sp. GG6-2]
MIPEETVTQIRSAVNIADYVGQVVALHKAGQNLFGICPFHAEDTPSFSVNESKQIFKCFSCGRGGNVFTFVMDYDKVSFPEAVAKVAEFAHIPLNIQLPSSRPPEDPAKAKQKELLRKITDMCHHILVNTESGEPALAYLQQRGLTEETIAHFDIGYAPSGRTLMRTFLTNQGFDYATQRTSGLFVEDEQGTLFDRFNDRVMFPLKDEYGDVIGFSGRVLTAGHQQAKYLNSPETSLFNKRDVLFNLDVAKSEFRQYGSAILFEGFMDVISAYQAGVPVGIASMGTSLTQEQVGIITHHTRQLTICYDGDAPGQKATERALALVANHPRLETNVVVLPDGNDPDEFIKAHGADAFAKQVQKVLTPTAFQLHYLAQDRDMTNDHDKLAYIDTALAAIAKTAQGATQAVYLQQVSDTTGVPVADLRLSLPTQTAPGPAIPPPDEPPPMPVEGFQDAPPAPVQYDKFERAERTLLAYVWKEPFVARELHNRDFQFFHEQYQSLFDAWLTYAQAAEQPTFAGYLDDLPQPLVSLATDISMLDLPEAQDELISDLIATVAAESTHQRLQKLKQDLRQAQQLGDKAGATQLGVQYIELLRTYKTNSNVE